MQSFRVVSPTTSVTYTLVGSATTLTKAITESLRIEVLRRKSLAFTGLGPNQMLDGTELEKQGVEFSIAEKDITDETCVAQIKKIKPAVVTAGHGWQGPYLTTFVPPVFTCPGECGEDCECQKVCKSVPLSINFLKEPTRVTLTLLNPTNSLKAFEVGATDPLPDSTNLNFRQTATFKSDKGIDRVVVGIDKKQPPAVVQIYYEYVVEEDDDTMAMH